MWRIHYGSFLPDDGGHDYGEDAGDGDSDDGKKYGDGDGDAGKEDGDGDGDGGIRSGCERTDVAKGKVSGESATDSCEN